MILFGRMSIPMDVNVPKIAIRNNEDECKCDDVY